MDALMKDPGGSQPVLEETLVRLFADFVRYQNQKDLQGIQRCLHSGSVSSAVMLKTFETLFDRFTLEISVLGSRYGGTDGEYAYCRFAQTIEKIAGPEFTNTRADNLAVFKEDDGAWKLWSCLPLTMGPA